MIIKPIITREVAEEINERVKREIDPKLFFFCNYEPTAFPSINEEGWFKNSVLDLYDFAIDSTFLFKKLTQKNSAYLNKSEIDGFDDLCKIYNEISALRSVFSHNQNNRNGYNERNLLTQADNWVNEKLRKSNGVKGIESSKDYKILNDALRHMAETLIDKANKIINAIKGHTKIEKIKYMWAEDTILWYSNTVKKSIYRGMLIDYYMSKAGDNLKDWSNAELNLKIDRWICNSYTYPVDCEIAKVKNEIKDMENTLKCTEENLKIIDFSNLSKAQEVLFKEKFNEKTAKVQEELDNLQNKLNDLEKEKKAKKDVGYFNKNLANYLRKTQKNLDNSGVEYTLLPEDFLIMNIEEIFDNIPSPDEDF